MERRIQAKPTFLFAFAHRLSKSEKEKLDLIVQRLGGDSRMSEDMYVRDATHVVVPDGSSENDWCPKIIGALAAGKTVLRTSYLIQSAQNGFFLPFLDDHIPQHFEAISRHYRRFGKPFQGVNAMVAIGSSRRRIELNSILRDAGAEVTVGPIDAQHHEQLVKVDIVFTDTILSQNLELQNFVQWRREQTYKAEADQGSSVQCRPMQVASYFGIFKVIQSCAKGKAEREKILSLFDVNNHETMAKIHPRS